jgi:hypothetical protein
MQIKLDENKNHPKSEKLLENIEKTAWQNRLLAIFSIK